MKRKLTKRSKHIMNPPNAPKIMKIDTIAPDSPVLTEDRASQESSVTDAANQSLLENSVTLPEKEEETQASTDATQPQSPVDLGDEPELSIDQILAESETLLSEITQYRNEMSSRQCTTKHTEATQPARVTQIQASVERASSSNNGNATAPDTQQASTSSGPENNPSHDDSVVVIDDNSNGAVHPIVVREDDDEVIFVHEVRAQHRVTAIVDLCDTPDNSFSSPAPKSDNSSPQKAETASAKANEPTQSPTAVPTIRCPICLDHFPMGSIYSTVCGHLYCGPCITGSIKTRKKCPMCNKALRPQNIHRIYMST